MWQANGCRDPVRAACDVPRWAEGSVRAVSCGSRGKASNVWSWSRRLLFSGERGGTELYCRGLHERRLSATKCKAPCSLRYGQRNGTERSTRFGAPAVSRTVGVPRRASARSPKGRSRRASASTQTRMCAESQPAPAGRAGRRRRLSLCSASLGRAGRSGARGCNGCWISRTNCLRALRMRWFVVNGAGGARRSAAARGRGAHDEGVGISTFLGSKRGREPSLNCTSLRARDHLARPSLRAETSLPLSSNGGPTRQGTALSVHPRWERAHRTRVRLR